MADNVTANAGSGGAVFATDDIGGTHYPITKLAFGPLDTANLVDDASGKRVPVKVAEALPTGNNNIGDVDVASSALPTGASTLAEQQTQTTALQLIDDTVATDGSATPTKGILIAGQDGTNAQSIKTDTNGELQIDVLSSALPTGAATLAEQQTQTTALQLLDDTVATDGSATPTKGILIAGQDGTNAQTIKTDTSGELQIDVLTLPALVAGTANIGDVDVASLPGALTGLAEDAAHVSGDVGIMSLAVRKDSGAAIAGTDGDYTPLQVDASGNLRVNIAAGGGGGGTSSTDEAAYTPTSSVGTPIMGAADESTPDAAAEGTLAIIRSTLSRALHVNIRDASGNEVSIGGGTQYDEDTASAAAEKVTMAGVVRKDTAASLVTTDADRTELIVDASGRLHVNVGTSALPTGASTLAEQQTQTTALQLIDDIIATDGSAAPTKGAMLAGTDGTNAQTVKVDTAGELQVDVLTLPAIPAGSNEIGRVRITDGTDLALVNTDGQLAVETDIPADNTGSGSITANGQSVSVTVTKGRSGFSWQITGTWTGTIDFEVSSDGGSNYVQRRVHNGTDSVGQTTANGIFVGSVAAATHVRVRSTAWTSGTATINHARSVGVATGFLNAPLPAGTNNIGDVDVVSSALPTGASTLAEQQTQTTALQLIDDTVATDGSAAPTKGIMLAGTDGTNAQTVKVDTYGELQVDVLTLPNVTLAAGTNTNEVVGDAAHDAAVAGNPNRIAGRARTSDYTAVANDDTADLLADTVGKQVILPYSIPENFTDGVTSAITGTTDTSVIATPGSGIRLYITSVLVTNSHATVGTVVELKDGSTVKYRGYAAPAGGGFAATFPTPIKLTANTAFNAANVTTGSNTYVSATAYKAP